MTTTARRNVQARIDSVRSELLAVEVDERQRAYDTAHATLRAMQRTAEFTAARAAMHRAKVHSSLVHVVLCANIA